MKYCNHPTAQQQRQIAKKTQTATIAELSLQTRFRTDCFYHILNYA